MTTDELFLVTDLPAEQLPPERWLENVRAYWGIETGLHARLDVSAEEDKSRVRKRNNALVLAHFRRVTVSLGIEWMRSQTTKRKKSLRDFHDFNLADGHRNAFTLTCKARRRGAS